MDTGHFVAWSVVLGTILIFGVAVMGWAYTGSGGVAVVFSEPVSLSNMASGSTPTVESEAIAPFQSGIAAFQAKRYRASIDQFQQTLKRDPSLAESHHNLGLLFANLRQDNQAAFHLVTASQLYAQQNNPTAIAQVKDHLATLKQRIGNSS